MNPGSNLEQGSLARCPAPAHENLFRNPRRNPSPKHPEPAILKRSSSAFEQLTPNASLCLPPGVSPRVPRPHFRFGVVSSLGFPLLNKAAWIWVYAFWLELLGVGLSKVQGRRFRLDLQKGYCKERSSNDSPHFIVLPNTMTVVLWLVSTVRRNTPLQNKRSLSQRLRSSCVQLHDCGTHFYE